MTRHLRIPDLNRKPWPVLPGWVISSVSVLSGPTQRGPHGDEGKAVGVWETLMTREVEGLPWEWTQAPLRRGAVYCLCDQLDSHLVVRHLYHVTEMSKEGTKEWVSESKSNRHCEHAHPWWHFYCHEWSLVIQTLYFTYNVWVHSMWLPWHFKTADQINFDLFKDRNEKGFSVFPQFLWKSLWSSRLTKLFPC